MPKTQSEDQAELLRVLKTQQHVTVKVTISSGKVVKKPLAKAIQLVKAGNKYRWSGSKFRVKHMEPIVLYPDRPWSSCYRTTRAPALQPSPEWVRRMSGNR